MVVGDATFPELRRLEDRLPIGRGLKRLTNQYVVERLHPHVHRQVEVGRAGRHRHTGRGMGLEGGDAGGIQIKYDVDRVGLERLSSGFGVRYIKEDG